MINYAKIAIPLFLGAIIIEWAIGFLKKKQAYNGKDTLANIALGLHAFFHGTMVKGIQLGVYALFFAITPLDLGWGIASWLLCLLGSDFIFYCFHRLGHESRIFWVAHQTHHSSTKYNFSVALRTPFHTLHRWIFWTPLALAGFDPVMILAVDSVSMMYQYFLHTEFIKTLGPLEWILNTPSHHRVHHACNRKYLDKNYGGVLIIWDRLLGTFQGEEEKPDYGLTEAVKTYNPFKLAFSGYRDAFRGAWKQPSLKKALLYLFERPKAEVYGDLSTPNKTQMPRLLSQYHLFIHPGILQSELA